MVAAADVVEVVERVGLSLDFLEVKPVGCLHRAFAIALLAEAGGAAQVQVNLALDREAHVGDFKK